MAKGRPDFFGTSIHPKFGTTNFERGIKVCTGGATTTVLEITAKGVLIGFLLWTYDTDAANNDSYIITLDGKILFDRSWGGTFDFGVVHNTDYILGLNIYDLDTPMFGLSSKADLPFESSVKIEYEVAGANDVNLVYDLFYYTVE